MNIKKIISKKENNERLEYEEIEFMVNGYLNKTIDDKDMSGFIMGIYNNGLTYKETFFLTDIMVKSGEVIDLSKINKTTVDKHSTGGIGDKVTIIVAPIVASLGLAVAKMSGRSLGYTGGTVDKLESIEGYNVSLSNKEFFDNVNKVGVAVISQSEEVAIADKKIYALRDEIGAVDSIPLIASSIMSKKIASGTSNIIIDLKVGSGAFMKKVKDAVNLSKVMIKIGKYYKKKVICILTDMNYPLGYTVGNALEIKEVVEFFDGICEPRLKELVIEISSNMVSLGKNISYAKARKTVMKSLNDGSAKNKFYEWIASQGGNLQNIKNDSNKLEILSPANGYITNIDALKIGKLVSFLGAGRKHKTDEIDYSVGVKLNKCVGEYVKKGELLGEIFYNKNIENVNNIFMDAFKIENKNRKLQSIVIKKIK